MHRVYQTIFGERGNCFAACVSTVTGFDLETVPNFCHAQPQEQWFDTYSAWLNARGFAPMSFQHEALGSEFPLLGWCRKRAPRLVWIATGLTATDQSHSVVYVGATLFHDPSPDPRPLVQLTDADLILPMLRS